MTLAQRRRDHQLSHLLADRDVLRIAEDALGGRVELHDAALVVHRDDCVERGVDNRALAGLAHADRLLRIERLDELTDLAPERFRERVDLRIALTHLVGEQLDHADALVAAHHGKRHAAVEVVRLSLAGSREVPCGERVTQPDRPPVLPRLSGKAMPRSEGELVAGPLEGIHLDALLAPVGDAAEQAVVANRPELRDLAPERPRDRGQKLGRGLVEAVGPTDGAHHAVLGAEPCCIALALGAKAGDYHGERAADQENPGCHQVPVAPECVRAGHERNRHGHGEHGYEHGLPDGGARGGDERPYEQKLNQQRKGVDR